MHDIDKILGEKSREEGFLVKWLPVVLVLGIIFFEIYVFVFIFLPAALFDEVTFAIALIVIKLSLKNF